ncbi:MAG: GerMN domain-containing protein [Paenibacillaceae bacterium]
MNKKLITVLCIVGCVIVLGGCGKGKQSITAANATPDVTISTTSVSTSMLETPKLMQMNLFYGNVEGDALVEKTVALKPDSVEPPYLEALNGLTKSPDDQCVALFAGFTFQSVVLKGNALTIDLSLPKESLLGAPGEVLLLEALQKTMFQFTEIQSIEVLVNGQKVESLLGHMDLPHPIAR